MAYTSSLFMVPANVFPVVSVMSCPPAKSRSSSPSVLMVLTVTSNTESAVWVLKPEIAAVPPAPAPEIAKSAALILVTSLLKVTLKVTLEALVNESVGL